MIQSRKLVRLRPAWGTKSGQAIVEYVVVAGMLLAALAILTLFLGTFTQFGTRVLNLVGSEYP